MSGKFIIRVTPEIRAQVADWDPETLIRQVCCPDFHENMEEAYRDIGAMFMHRASPDEMTRHMVEVRARCSLPPVFVSDLECGAGSMIEGATRFTSMMGLCRTGNPEYAWQVGRCAALEAGNLGMHWTLAPVADLAMNPDSPVVGRRSSGRDPDLAIAMLGAYIRGLQEHGMMATLKHFPGDGSDDLDQHLTTPEVKMKADVWRQTQGRVFRELIAQGAMAVMPGHIAFPDMDTPDPDTGLYPPATLSEQLLQGVLRGELGFEGLIVTDAINMGGVVGYMSYYDACARALVAGCDCILFPKVGPRFYSEMTDRVRNGTLPLHILQDRAARMVAAKRQLEERRPDSLQIPDRIAMNALAETISRESLTLVRDRAGLIPFHIGPETRVLYISLKTSPSDIMERMTAALRGLTQQLTVVEDPGPDDLFDAAQSGNYDLFICSVECRLNYGLNVVRLHGPVARNMMGGWSKLDVPVMFIAHEHPFLHEEYMASMDTVINAYGDIPRTPELILDAITGKTKIKRL